ncbi:MAG: ATP-binding protein [Paludibacteraceae bacterium]|nr:ATP-binding protein [Paludibacteraceae bacterium]
MKIRNIYLKNFRGYSEINIPINSDFTTIIGKNDVGKSTIFEALEIFFNNETVKIELDDLNVKTTEKQIIIGVSFEVDSSKEYLLDSERKTSLQEEYLLNKDGLLEIRKIWDCTKSLTAKSLSTYIWANYLSDYAETPLITLTITKLKEISKQLDLDDRIEDRRVVSNFRKAIYQNTENKERKEILIPIDKEDAKAIYNSIASELPFFALFQSDRANKDSDKEVQDPLKVITKRAISDLESQLNDVVNQIKAKAMELGRQTVAQIEKMDPEIAQSLIPNVKTKNWDSLFSFSFSGDENIPMNKRGSGIRRLILLNYFKAEAENRTTDGRTVIYAIEEPETSQHPNYQIMLVNALQEIASAENRQVFITTHSPEIAKMVNQQDLIFIKRDENKKPCIVQDSEVKMSQIKETLGIVPYLSKLIMCVEGEFDIKFLKNIGSIPELKSIFDLDKISIIPMIGGNLHNWVDRNYLKDTNVIEFHLYDSDINSGKNEYQYKPDCDIINARGDDSIALLTNKREMENYIPISVYREYFKDITWDDDINQNEFDFPSFVKNHIPKLTENAVKNIINGSVAKKLTKEHLEEINAWEEVKGWFEKLKELYEV